MAKKARAGGGDEYQTTIGRKGIRSKLSGNKTQQNKIARVSYDDDLLRNKPARGGKKQYRDTSHQPKGTHGRSQPT